MKHFCKTLFIFLAVVAVVTLAGCAQSEVRIKCQGTNMPGHMAYRYDRFTGDAETHNVSVKAGQTLVLTYDVVVNAGTLSIQVDGPDNETVWEIALQEGAQDTVELALEEGGQYCVVVMGKKTGGSFDVSWELRD